MALPPRGAFFVTSQRMQKKPQGQPTVSLRGHPSLGENTHLSRRNTAPLKGARQYPIPPFLPQKPRGKKGNQSRELLQISAIEHHIKFSQLAFVCLHKLVYKLKLSVYIKLFVSPIHKRTRDKTCRPTGGEGYKISK